MTHLIDKNALVAEINRIIKEETEMFNEQCQGGYEPSPSPAVVCMRMEKLRSFLDTLEVKEVDFDEIYHKFLQDEWFGKHCSRPISEFMAFTAMHFFELGLKAQKGE